MVTVAMNLEIKLQEDRVSGLFYPFTCHKCLEQNLPWSGCLIFLGWMNDLLEKSKGEERVMRGPKLGGAPGKAFPQKPHQVDMRLCRCSWGRENELGEWTRVSGLRSLWCGVDRGRQGPDGAEPPSGMLLKPAQPRPSPSPYTKRNPN